MAYILLFIASSSIWTIKHRAFTNRNEFDEEKKKQPTRWSGGEKWSQLIRIIFGEQETIALVTN